MKPDPDEKAWLDAEAAWLGPEADAVEAEKAAVRAEKTMLDEISALVEKKPHEGDQQWLRESLTALLARGEALTARVATWKQRFAAYAARRDARAQRDKDELTDEGLIFELAFDGRPVIVANTIKGACFRTSEIADILGCDHTDLASVPGIFLDDVLAKSMRYGPRGAQLRKWLKIVIRPSKQRIRPEIIEQGLLIYDLTPVLAPDGSILRLKETVMITPEGQAAEERDGAVVH
jgi:hypothetical protein